ncbi:MAG TPA: TetR family transcriptional regulator [Egibacteraceae bacterium]|nr:TetR family transcriptional regulator [Egibacteraceae bacterium]
MATAGLRERKKRQTRDALISASMRLFVTQGFEATTVDQIADAAQVSPRTFFRYFAAKEDVLFDDFEAEVDRWEAALLARPRGESLGAALREATLAIAEPFSSDEHRRDAQRFAEIRFELVASSPALARRSLEFDGRAQERAAVAIARLLGIDLDSDLRPRIVAAAAMAAVWTATRLWHQSDQDRPLTAVVREAYDLLEHLEEVLAIPLSRLP